MFDHVSWEAVGIAFTIIGATYIFIRNLKTDIKADMDKFERRWEIMDEKHEKHRESIDNKWVELLKEIHSLDKKIEKRT